MIAGGLFWMGCGIFMMKTMMASLPSAQAVYAVILVGIAAFLLVMAFFPAQVGAVNKRLKSIHERREALKKHHQIDGGGKKKRRGDLDEGAVRVMRNAVEKFRMEEMLNNTELKQKLSQAGYRGKKAPVVFLFFKIVMPLLLFIASLLYYWLIFKGEFQPVRHGLISLMVAVGGYMLPGIWMKNVRILVIARKRMRISLHGPECRKSKR